MPHAAPSANTPASAKPKLQCSGTQSVSTTQNRIAARTTAETATNRCGGAEKLAPALIDRNPEPRCAAKRTLGSAPCRERDHRPARASPDAPADARLELVWFGFFAAFAGYYV